MADVPVIQRLSELSTIITLFPPLRATVSLPTGTFNGTWSRFSISDYRILSLATVSTISWKNKYSISSLAECGMTTADKVFRCFLKPFFEIGSEPERRAHTDFTNKARTVDQEDLRCGVCYSSV